MASPNDSVNHPSQNSESSTPNQRRLDGQRGGQGRRRGRGGLSSKKVSPHGEAELHSGPGQVRAGSQGAHNGIRRPNAATASGPESPSRFTQLPASAQAGNVSTAAAEAVFSADASDAITEVCFICASSVVHYSVAPCNHRTCHICALRMRALYKTKDCAHCRREAQYVVFTDSPLKQYQEFGPADLVSTDKQIGIKYEKADIVEDTILLLRYNCPDPSCDVACLGWPDLHRHVRGVHHRKMCDLCTRNKKVFTHEHELFTDKELERHMRKGDDNPGAVDQSGFRGHPLCDFCGERFYGDDELYAHLREKHERCFICDRRQGRQPSYFQNYNSLEQHFRKDHFLCADRGCMEKKFVVFESEIDLKAHQLQEHADTLSKDVRRDARTVDMSSFEYRAPYSQQRQTGAGQREGRGRGRDPNADVLPRSSAQPLRRDEQAFQRQLAIQGAQSLAQRVFGGQLTPVTPASQTAIQSPQPISRVDEAARQFGEIQLQGDLTPQEQSRRLRHSSVLERASTLLQNDSPRLSQFRTFISSYRTNSISAPALIDSFFALFSDTSSSALGSLIRDVADLYEDRVKAEALRTAWNDWRAVNEDYPSLPVPIGLSGSNIPLGWAQVTATPYSSGSSTNTKSKSTSRVLKLKSSTSQSSRSSASRNASWGSNSASSTNGFSDLTTPSMVGNASGSPSWITPSEPSGSNSARPTPPTSRPTSLGPARIRAPSSDAFPALPPATKPTTSIFGYGRGAVRRDVVGGSSGNFAWGANSSVGNAGEKDVEDKGENEEIQPKRKGNKGKKQVLIQWG